jgi:hypothetical protein
MASLSDRFSRLEKVAVFLIVLGPDKARQILADVDLETVEAINASMLDLGDLRPEEKAAVMIEFAGFFYDNKPLTDKLKEPAPKKRAKKSSTSTPHKMPSTKSSGPTPHKMPSTKPQAQQEQAAPHKMPSTQADEDDETTILNTLQKLRERVDPNKIDWGRAGYDFGDGFKGKGSDRG